MHSVFWLREGEIAGRSGPDRDPWDPQELADSGIGAVLSVNDGILVYPDILQKVGIEYRCVPLTDSAPPQPGDLEICVNALPGALEFVLSSLDAGRSVLVHCTSGKDRTGLFLSYYLCATEGMTAGQAIKEVRRVRDIALSAEGWDKFALQVLGSLIS